MVLEWCVRGRGFELQELSGGEESRGVGQRTNWDGNLIVSSNEAFSPS